MDALFNVGEMRDRLEVLTLEHKVSENTETFEWVQNGKIWAKSEKQKKTNLFSKVGLGVSGMIFTVRSRPLTLNHALRYKGRHCFITDITEVRRGFLAVTAALIEPVLCSVSRTETVKDTKFNRPTIKTTKAVVFPAFLTEKYTGFEKKEPQDVTSITYVLVTPKAVTLETGEVVTIDGKPYCVQVGHILDEHKNEFEIWRKEDA